MAITADARYVISASNKLIIFDLSTGEVFRTINPEITGIVSTLSVSPNDKYCVCTTTLNQVIICNIQTGDFQLLANPVQEAELLGNISTTYKYELNHSSIIITHKC